MFLGSVIPALTMEMLIQIPLIFLAGFLKVCVVINV